MTHESIHNNNCDTYSDNITIYEHDSLHSLVTKCAVIHLTQFYKQLTEDPDFKRMECIGTHSHYSALYWYKQQKFDVVLNLCQRISTEEDSLPKYNGKETIEPPVRTRLLYLPSCFYPFQDLFDSDVICLTGVLFMVCRTLLPVHANVEQVRDFKGDELFGRNDTPIYSVLRPRFLAQYLNCSVFNKTREIRSIN